MKAIYAPKCILCVVVEDTGDGVILEPVDGDADQRFSVGYDSPYLVLDPTDDEIEAIDQDPY